MSGPSPILFRTLVAKHELVAASLQNPAEHLFGRARVVHVGGVQKIDAVVQTEVDHPGSNRFGRLASEGHGPEADA